MIAKGFHERPKRGQQMRIVEDVSELRRLVSAAKRQGRTVTFVPTMGALHEGHATLMRSAAYDDDNLVVASVFVNPTQFGVNEDFTRYPRDTKGDAEKSAAAGVDVLFMPSVDAIYPVEQTKAWVNVEGLTEALCGHARPTHFRGVTTVVAKLFNIVQPDEAFFGEKDYQQLSAIRRMVKELLWPIRVVGVPTVREADGLAMSSRNAYLTPQERAQAPALYEALGLAKGAFLGGERRSEVLGELVRAHIAAKCAVGVVDYIEIVDPYDLRPLNTGVGERALIALAVQVGKARLIDNLRLDEGGEG